MMQLVKYWNRLVWDRTDLGVLNRLQAWKPTSRQAIALLAGNCVMRFRPMIYLQMKWPLAKLRVTGKRHGVTSSSATTREQQNTETRLSKALQKPYRACISTAYDGDSSERMPMFKSAGRVLVLLGALPMVRFRG
ncbi:hypothetical protein WJ67_14865 [Burkholderia ubonensis]|nr:hypothetical protein WJ67_14865 [Burkholderia ubonensis]